MLLPPAAVMATWPAPNYVNPQNHGPGLFIVDITLMVVVLIVVGIRYYTRLRVTKTFGPDDFLIGVALIPTIGLSTITILDYDHSKYDRHIWDVLPSTITSGIRLEVACEVLYCAASILTKLSLACFYLRLIAHSGRKRYEMVIYASMGIFVAEWIGFTVTAFTQCRPLSAYWDVEPQYPYVCVNIGMFTLVCGILNILTDFLCLFLPVPMIWNIQRPKKQRIAILAMFAVGALTCVAGIARTIYADITLRKTYDMTWWLYPLHLATALEIDVGLICASLPALRALFLHHTSQDQRQNQAEQASLSWFRPFKNSAERVGSDDDREAKGGVKLVKVHCQEDVSNQLAYWDSTTTAVTRSHESSF